MEIKKRTAFLSIILQIYRKIKRRKKPAVKAERGEAGSLRYAHYGSCYFCKRYPPESPNSYGVSITVLLTAMMLCSIREESSKEPARNGR